LLHDIGKPDTRTVELEAAGTQRVRFLGHDDAGAELAHLRLDRLRFSRQEIELSSAIVRAHMRPHHLDDAFAASEISRRARYRFFRDVRGGDLERPAGVDVLLLAIADLLGTRTPLPQAELHGYLVHIAQMLAFVFSEKGVEGPSLRPLADGRVLMQELGMSPGPSLGQLLAQLAEAQAAGEITTPAAALELARSLVSNGDSV
jgi:hypothetical protein